MPYIDQSARPPLHLGLNYTDRIMTTGELNFVITSIIDAYIQQKGKRYDTLNAVVGVLECAKLELYREIVAPYEDDKLVQNGGVYTV